MIISKPFGVVYVAIPKTATQSLSFALEQQLKGDDVPYAAESLHDWHATFNEAVESTPELPLNNYWSFGFVRNPFDRFISYCAGHVEGFNVAPQQAIQQALEEARAGENRWLLPQVNYLDGLRKVYRYEQFNEAVVDIEKRVGISLGEVPRLNVSEREPYRGYYDDALKDAISELYKNDLYTLDYRF